MLNRRKFCLLTMGLGAAGFGVVDYATIRPDESPNGLSTDSQFAGNLVFTSRSSSALGAHVSMKVLHADRGQAERAITAVFDELQVIEQVMSLYQPESQLCRLNRDGVLHNPHPYLVSVLQAARAMSSASDGAFDITVQPLWQVYAAARLAGLPPDPTAVAGAQAQADWRRVEIQPAVIRLRGHGTAVTLNGIAQGFAADQAISILRRHGIKHALINTGELAAIGRNAHAKPWGVGIQHPRQSDAYMAIGALSNRCLATSGDYATPLSSDFRDHHIFDPRIGRSPTTFSSVSVVAPTACEADALSTALFVLGPEQGLALVRSRPACDALLAFKDGRVLTSAGFPLADA
jgi:thiamine biosynthesis lipoprotein